MKQKQKQLTTNVSDNKLLPSYEEVVYIAKATPGHGRYGVQSNGKNLVSVCGRHNKFHKSDCFQHHAALRGKRHHEEHQNQCGDWRNQKNNGRSIRWRSLSCVVIEEKKVKRFFWETEFKRKKAIIMSMRVEKTMNLSLNILSYKNCSKFVCVYNF